MNNLITLPFPVRPQPLTSKASLQPGWRYQMNIPDTARAGHDKGVADFDNDPHSGLIGAYRLNTTAAEIETVDVSAQPMDCFVWDVDLLNPMVSDCLKTDREPFLSTSQNGLSLHDAILEGPEVQIQNNLPVLTISPRLTLEWSTGAYASQLGLVQLVESSRTIVFEEGETCVLLDTEAAGVGPVLYLADADDKSAVKPVCAFQQQGDRQHFDFTTEIRQAIPAEFKGKPVVSVSVLEKYTWYFMQNAAPDDQDGHIWVPVHLPIVWGWSTRVQQRFDGVWDIFRKKLIMPLPSTEAPSLPLWQSNSQLCCSALN